MLGRCSALLAPLAIVCALAACSGARPRLGASECAEAQRLLGEADTARREGYLFRTLARSEAADRACSTAGTRAAVAEIRGDLAGRPGDPPPAPGDAAELRAAAVLRLAGEPGAARAKLLPLAARLDPAGLAELARTEAASRHAAEARAALEKAAARAEQRHGGRGRWRWQQSRHERLAGLAYSPDGTKLVSADREGLIRVWDAAAGHEILSMKSKGWPSSLEISPDGAWIAAAGGNGPVEVFELATGKRVIEHPADAPAMFTPEGHLVVTSSRREGFVELEVPSGKERARFATGWPRNTVVTRDRIYATDEDAQRRPVIRVWERGGTQRQLAEHPLTNPIWDLAVSPRGELVVLSREEILILDAAGAQRHAILGEHATMALSPDGKRLLASTGDGAVRLFDLATGQQIRSTEASSTWVLAALHPRGAVVATAGVDGIQTWSLANDDRTSHFGRPSTALAVAFDEGGTRLAVGTAAGTATVWDLASGGVSSVTPRAGSPVTAVAFGAGGVLATASAPPSPKLIGRQGGAANLDSTLAVWDARGAKRWSKDLEQIMWLGFRPGTDTLAAASMLPTPKGTWIGLTVWDPKGAPQQQLGEESQAGFAWTPDGARLTYTAGDRLALAPLDGGPATRLRIEADRVAFQPGGPLIAVTNGKGRISLWASATGTPERVMLEELGGEIALAWSPRGDVLATSAADQVRLWDPRTGARLASLAAHAQVTSIAYRPDGRLLAVACADGLVELWSVADAALVAMLAQPGEGRGLVLAPDGAVDGALSDEDPLYWVAGDTVLPGRAAWDREARPGLLAARLAQVPAETAPRAGRAGAAPPLAPPACFAPPTDEDQHPQLVSLTAPEEQTVSLCANIESSGDHGERLPTCFLLDLATGAYRPRAPTPDEALGRYTPPTAAPTISFEGTQAKVCRAGACRPIAIPELPQDEDQEPTADVSDDGRLLAVLLSQGSMGESVDHQSQLVVYDLATGRRLRRQGVGSSHTSIFFVENTLLVTNTPCAGPCSSSWLLDPRTGRRLGEIGGREPLNTSNLSVAQVAGTVYAFGEWDSPALVFQDVATGRVVRRSQLPELCAGADPNSGECDARMLHVKGGLAVVGTGTETGNVTRVDAAGKVVSRHRMPVCPK